MKRLLAILGFLLLMLAPTTVASAHDTSWSPGPMKSDGAHPSLLCTAVTSYQGHTRRYEYQMAGDPSQPLASEKAWLVADCVDSARKDARGFFKYTEGLDVPDDAIKIAWKHL